MKINPNIEQLIPYQSKQVDVAIRLNANETKNFLFKEGVCLQYDFNEYPVSRVIELREKLAQKYLIDSENILLGNGSTELLELIVKTYSEDNDNALTISPSFAMYDVYSQMHGVTLQKVPLQQDGTLDIDEYINYIQTNNPTIIFLCNPNNPTGTIIKKKDVLRIVESTSQLVVVDEAYMEFANETFSVANEINNYPNLIVARTFSKAYGLASIRLGYIISNTKIINQVSKVKLPYSLNTMTALVGIQALNQESKVNRFVTALIKQREVLYNEFKTLGYTVYPSQTNFLYIKTKIKLQDELLKYNILIRSFNNDTYRITVGDEEENTVLIQALKEVTNENIKTKKNHKGN